MVGGKWRGLRPGSVEGKPRVRVRVWGRWEGG